MTRTRPFARAAAVLGALATLGIGQAIASAPAGAVPTTYANPVSPSGTSAANPAVLRDADGTYYAYVNGTSSTGAVPVLTSTDLATWTAGGNVLATPGSWASTTATNFSSPSVARYPGNPAAQRYVLYYTGVVASTSKKCIGVATSASPTGPFVDSRSTPLVCGVDGARDPSIYQGVSPQLIHYENAATDGIYNQVLTADGLSVSTSLPAPYLLRTMGSWWQESVTDRPAIVASGSSAWLFYGGGTRTSGRHAVGWSSCTMGYGIAIACTNRTYPSPSIASTDTVESPGGIQPFADASGRTWIAYDGLGAGACSGGTCTGTRTMRIDKLCIGPEGPRTTAPSTGGTLSRNADCATDIPTSWVTTAASAIVEYGASWSSTDTFPSFNLQTLRQGAHTTVGGSAVRVHLSNRMGTQPLVIDGASVGVNTTQSGDNQVIQTGGLAQLRFGGLTTVTIPAGGMATSDAVTLNVPANWDVAVSLYFAANTGAPNGAIYGGQTAWRSGSDRSQQTSGGGFTQSRSSVAIVSGIDVLASDAEGTLAIIGDSKTDGYLAVGVDSQHRWTDRLYDRYAGASPARAVAVDNLGSAGNAILPTSGDLSSGVGRFGRDVLGRAGVRTVVIALGTNDVLVNATESQIATGLQTMVDKAKGDGLRVILATIPPIAGPRAVSTCTDAGAPNTTQNNVRKAINDRIRGVAGTPFTDVDGVLDLDKALRDPGSLDRIACGYSYLNTSHPSEAGHQRMADYANLTALMP